MVEETMFRTAKLALRRRPGMNESVEVV
jgi:hypothetical protein